MIFKLSKAALSLALVVAFLPTDYIGAMPGLDEQSPAAFARYGKTALATLGGEASRACEGAADLCDSVAQSADATVELASTALDASAIAQDPIARRIAFESARGLASTL